ncbi:MAG: alpha/beta hydrolase [Legionellaceae bacterium]
MLLSQAIEMPGEHLLELPGELGPLEACLNVPNHKISSYVAILGHPHSLHGGTMNNKVVTTLSRVFKDLGIVNLRFNFRGVGNSYGAYDAGLGESLDMCQLAHYCQEVLPSAACIFAGFSFGSYVAYRAASLMSSRFLIMIAPSVDHYDYTEFKSSPTASMIVAADLDEIVPLSSILSFADQTKYPVLRFPEATHFFHGQLLNLKAALTDAIQNELSL